MKEKPEVGDLANYNGFGIYGIIIKIVPKENGVYFYWFSKEKIKELGLARTEEKFNLSNFYSTWHRDPTDTYWI